MFVTHFTILRQFTGCSLEALGVFLRSPYAQVAFLLLRLNDITANLECV
jgi:hypothetical protein